MKKHEDSGDKKSRPDELNAWIKEHLKKHPEWDSYSELPAEPGAEVPVPDLNEQILQAVEERKKSAREAFVIAKKVCEGKKGLTEVGITKLLTELKSSEAEFSGTRLQILKALLHLAKEGGKERCELFIKAIKGLIELEQDMEIIKQAVKAAGEINRIKSEINGIPEDKKAFPQHKDTVTPAKMGRPTLAIKDNKKP